MNENLLDVLLYLFENFSMPEAEQRTRVRADLDEAGFLPDEIDDAFDWIRGTRTEGETLVKRPDDQALRLYHPGEQQILSPACRGYLTRLQRCGVLGAAARETVIDRLLALAGDNDDMITVEQLKWVVLMVLSSNGEERAYAHMQALLDAERPGAPH